MRQVVRSEDMDITLNLRIADVAYASTPSEERTVIRCAVILDGVIGRDVRFTMHTRGNMRTVMQFWCDDDGKSVGETMQALTQMLVERSPSYIREIAEEWVAAKAASETGSPLTRPSSASDRLMANMP